MSYSAEIDSKENIIIYSGELGKYITISPDYLCKLISFYLEDKEVIAINSDEMDNVLDGVIHKHSEAKKKFMVEAKRILNEYIELSGKEIISANLSVITKSFFGNTTKTVIGNLHKGLE